MKTTSKTILITGATRGIGEAIALRFADAGFQVAVLAQDSPENMERAAQQMTQNGRRGIILSVDVRDTIKLKQAVTEATAQFGRIDVLVNNTSATGFADSVHTTPEQFDMMISTSARAAFFLSQACFPLLKAALNPHIINISPPLNLDSHFFKSHLAFSMSKYAMSLCTLGMAAEFKQAGIAVNSLWPETTIATQTIQDHFKPKVYAGSRWPSIMADAAYEIARRKARDYTGRFFTDEAILRETGVTDFSMYAVDPSVPLHQSLFVPLKQGMLPITLEMFR